MLSVQEMRVRCRGLAKDLDMIAKRAFSNIRVLFAKRNKEQAEMDREERAVLMTVSTRNNSWVRKSCLKCDAGPSETEIEEKRRAFIDKYRLHGRAAGESEEAIEDHIQWALANLKKFQLPRLHKLE